MTDPNDIVSVYKDHSALKYIGRIVYNISDSNYYGNVKRITSDKFAVDPKTAWSVVNKDTFKVINYLIFDGTSHGTSVTKERFIDFLKSDYPDDFELVLFHPEILEGRYDV